MSQPFDLSQFPDLPPEVVKAVSALQFELSVERAELLSNLVFEGCWSCGDLVEVCGFNSVFERDACDDFREVVKAA